MEKPFISVIIPTLNEEGYISKLLASLADQTCVSFEVIISDGNSIDATRERVQEWSAKLPGLTVLTSDLANVSAQRNKGANVAKGEWLVFVDADAILFPYALERILSAVHNHTDKVYTSWFSPDSSDESDAVWVLLANMFVEGSLLFRRPLAPGGMFIIAREHFFSTGGFNERVTFGEDYDLTKRLQDKGVSLSVIRETLSVFSLRRIRSEGKLKFLQVYVKASLLVLFTKKNLTQVPGYFWGRQQSAHVPNNKNFLSLKSYEIRLKRMIHGLLRFIETGR